MKAILIKQFLTLYILLFSGSVFAQQNTVKSLNVGEAIPDIDFQVDNYKDQTINLSKIKGKLIIVDLWATTCGGCIQAMPKMQRLQDIFGDKILIVLATKETKEKVQSVASKNENIRNVKLPMLYGADGLGGYFHYKWLPSHVWIDKNGKVLYFSGSEISTEENIKKYLNNEPLNILVEQKNDIALSGSISYQEQLMPYHRENYGFTSFFARHDPSKYTPGGGSSIRLIRRFPNETHNTIQCTRCTMGILYITAYDMRNVNMIFNRIVYEGNITQAMIDQKYHYEFSCDQTVNEDEFFRRAIRNLDEYLNVSSSIGRRPVKCLLMKRLDTRNTKMYSKAKNNDERVYVNSYNNTVELGNVKLSDLTREMKMFTSGMYTMKYPIFDETGIDPYQPLTFTMSLDWDNIEKVNESLKPFGLYLEETERAMDCIVIHKK